MSSLLHTRFSALPDPGLQALIDDLYLCFGHTRNDQSVFTFYSLLSNIVIQAPKCLDPAYLPGDDHIALTNVGSLTGPVYDLCVELCHLKHISIETFTEKSVLTLIRECFLLPEPDPGLTAYDREAKVTQRRRANRGS